MVSAGKLTAIFNSKDLIVLTDKNRSSLASLEFATTAKDFCDWCERPLGALSDNEAAYWLGRLYSDALKLPETGPENGEDLPDLPQSAHLKAKENLAPFWGDTIVTVSIQRQSLTKSLLLVT
jgi:hypothetical protein